MTGVACADVVPVPVMMTVHHALDSFRQMAASGVIKAAVVTNMEQALGQAEQGQRQLCCQNSRLFQASTGLFATVSGSTYIYCRDSRFTLPS